MVGGFEQERSRCFNFVGSVLQKYLRSSSSRWEKVSALRQVVLLRQRLRCFNVRLGVHLRRRADISLSPHMCPVFFESAIYAQRTLDANRPILDLKVALKLLAPITQVLRPVAIRIIRTAQELAWSTVAIYPAQDTSNAVFADGAVKLDDIPWSKRLERNADIGRAYGFFSEGFAVAYLLSSLTPGRLNVTPIGRAPDTLRIAGDTMVSRDLANALESGRRGGHGIHVVSAEEGVEEAFKRMSRLRSWAMPRETWRLCELQCSEQWLFQRVVKLSPTHLRDEDGTGTFEYLANSQTAQWVFEINPRIQVEHTATDGGTHESRSRARPASLLICHPRVPRPHPSLRWRSVQLRITADNPAKDFRLSVGAIPAQLHRVAQGARGARRYVAFRGIWGEPTQRAGRALVKTRMGIDSDDGGVKTNAGVGRRDVEQVPSVSGSGSRAMQMQPSAIFHVVLSPPGSKVPSDARKDALALASIAHNTVPTYLLGMPKASSRLPPSHIGDVIRGIHIAQPSHSSHQVLSSRTTRPFTSKARYTGRSFSIRRSEKIAVHVAICGPKAEKILGCELKTKEYDMRRNFLETGNFGFCVQEYINFDPGIGILGMDFNMIMGRLGNEWRGGSKRRRTLGSGTEWRRTTRAEMIMSRRRIPFL
ncbi:hypothetical protein FIBSPDRAFT_888885 [Athelia psychrophila]|uniref:Carbamoyl-phosphate synthetase large subunit-like ATP-binding domain-containing protein n=1 Tax=Athelia psychrophila TaxID=1759441 RepID=A0A166MY05_9AGAM|nr:hypothetical protein FIBSPDRAFT_888885 [Fibularhizoctonia sp. CBS 109695]